MNINGQTPPSPPSLSVSRPASDGLSGQPDLFSSSFRIGRDPSCAIQIDDPVVSRRHAEVVLLGDTWWLRDTNSANGIFVGGKKVDRLEIHGRVAVELGRGGPSLTLTVEEPPPKPNIDGQDPLSMTHYQKHYFGENGDKEAGEHTMMVRRAFAQVQKKQKKKYWSIIAVVLCLFVVAGSFAVYNQLRIGKQKKLAAEIFYAMKAQEVEFGDFLRTARESKDPAIIAKVERYKQKARDLENSYSEFVKDLGIYDQKISRQDQLILKTARVFGECEVLMPSDFKDEVLRYIKKWQSSSRYANALQRARKNKYIPTIARTMAYYGLPPQFFYLAMQESNFDVNACGPKTRWGIAKGMWQFIPTTASHYGLSTGPLVKERKPDPRDERHDFAKSTLAAGNYLRAIYDTDAQASGLLVMASYNWGENRVNRLIDQMPQNPKERNFWQFFKQYRDKIPKQTYDYVLYIFSAAVIGEDPRFFGFTFDNPLASVDV